MIMPPRPPPALDDAYSGSIGRWRGATDARATNTGCDGPSAARTRPIATATDATRGCSAGGKAAAGLERTQPPHLAGRPQTFFERLDGDRAGAHDRQQGQRPHGAGDRPVPARPGPHFIVLQAHLPRGRLNAALDGPAAPRHLYDLLQGGSLRGKD